MVRSFAGHSFSVWDGDKECVKLPSPLCLCLSVCRPLSACLSLFLYLLSACLSSSVYVSQLADPTVLPGSKSGR
jgi:hypothetical protein